MLNLTETPNTQLALNSGKNMFKYKIRLLNYKYGIPPAKKDINPSQGATSEEVSEL